MKVRFWGARGSVPVSGPDFSRAGGNTSCVELEHEGQRLILDGGTGLTALGRELGAPLDATVLFSHFHWDHIQGVPFFGASYHPASNLTFAAVGAPGALREALAAQMRPPSFPVGLELLQGIKAWDDLRYEEHYEAGPFRILPLEQPHPNGVACYQIEVAGRRLVYATDVEHGGQVSQRLLDASQGADLLIHDSQYHWAEYTGEQGPPKRGWGHSTWLESVQAAQQAEVARLALFHHDPTRDDAGVDLMEELAQERFAGAFAAREGVVLEL